MSIIGTVFNGITRLFRSGGYSLNNPSLPLSDPKIWQEVFGDSQTTETGDTINSAKALSYAPVWQAVSLISGDIAKLPLDLYERRPDIAESARVKVDTQLSRVVNRRPNSECTAVKFWRRVMVHALIWEKSWIYIVPDGLGRPAELVQLLPDRTWHERIDGVLYVATEAGGKIVTIPCNEVMCIEWINDGINECSLLKMARNSWALGLAQEKFSSRFFRNGARVGGILELPAAMAKTARDTVEEGFRKSYEGTDNPFKTVVLREGAKFHAAQQSPQDSQMVEATVAQVEQVARWFNLPPNKLNVKGSSSYNSEEQQNQAYLDQTLAIWLKQIADECTAKLLTPQEQETMFFEHNTAALLRLDLLKRYQAYQIGIASRFMNPNEVRARENLLPYEGGDKFENPNTSSPADAQDSTETDASGDDSNDNDADEMEAEQNSLTVTLALADHLRRTAAKGGKAFCDLIDGGLQSHRTGDDAAIDAVLNDCRQMLEVVKEGGLCGAVDEILRKYGR